MSRWQKKSGLVNHWRERRSPRSWHRASSKIKSRIHHSRRRTPARVSMRKTPLDHIKALDLYVSKFQSNLRKLGGKDKDGEDKNTSAFHFLSRLSGRVRQITRAIIAQASVE
jgi:hypothetical protein